LSRGKHRSREKPLNEEIDTGRGYGIAISTVLVLRFFEDGFYELFLGGEIEHRK